MGGRDVGVAERGGDGEQGGEAGGVVADAGSEDAGVSLSSMGSHGGAGGEDGVEVGGEEDAGEVRARARSSVGGARVRRGRCRRRRGGCW